MIFNNWELGRRSVLISPRMSAAVILLMVMFLASSGVTANATTWTALNYPGAGNTYARGIDGANLVGEWWGADFSSGPFGYIYDGSSWNSFQYPGSIWSQFNDVDGSQIVGAYSEGLKVHGFSYNGATWQSLDFPGSNQTFAYGVDGSKVVGLHGSLGASQGFLYDGATWTTLNYPGARSTAAGGISGSKIVGRYADVAFRYHGFMREGATWTTIDYPGAEDTSVFQIDGSNIVGSYYKNDAFHGFLFDGVTWTTLDFPGALHTEVYGVDGSRVAGVYTEESGLQHGFLATVSQSDTFRSVGDFNEDGFVNAADYPIWRKSVGSIYVPTEFDVWRSYFGQAVTIHSGASRRQLDHDTVPEPSSALLLVLTLTAPFVSLRGSRLNSLHTAVLRQE